MAAAVDRGGELLRVRVSNDRALEDARRVLAELGYRATVAPFGIDDRQWYGPATVGDLSRVEAQVIADRVVGTFGARHGLASDLVGSLTSVVAASLYECFAAHTLGADAAPGSLREVCAEAASAAAAPLIGEDAARDLASAVCADLSRGRS